jgi:ATP phosphoribosyltransferase
MENITLTITDLATLRNIVDLASTRGAFRANELREVGEVFDRLNQFVEASVAAAQAQQDTQTVTQSNNESQTSAKGA